MFAVLVLAGLLFAVSATTARGTQLRTDRGDAAGFFRDEQARYATRLSQLQALRKEVDERTKAEAGGNAVVGRCVPRRALSRGAQGWRPSPARPSR